VETMLAVSAAGTVAQSKATEYKEEEARTRGGMSAAPADQAMVMVDAHGLIRHCSRGAGELLASPPQAVRGKSLSKLMPDLPLRRETPGYNLAYLIMNYAPGAWHAGCIRTAEGRPVLVEFSMVPMRLGRQTWLLLNLREKSPEPQFQNHLERLIVSLGGSREAAVVTSPAGVIEYVNPAYEVLTGYGLSEVVGQTQRILKSGEQPSSFYQALWETLAAGRTFRGVFANRAKDGHLFHVDQVIRPFMDRGGRVTHYVATCRDVSHQIRAQEELRHRAEFDGLTGLANRYLLCDRLHQEIARARREHGMFALVCVDLDRFKAINDVRGHLAGDSVLRAVSSQLVQAVREMDTLGRWGGDEFLLILPGVCEPVDVQAVLAKIVASVQEVSPEMDALPPVTLSAGAAIFPADADEADDLIHKADLAMYQAKLRGGNGYCAWGTALWERAPKGEPAKPGGAPRPRRTSPARGHLTCVRGGARSQAL
jgi:diguanylate cyclase (GGDEF)-like protein/PAS domain S-box-containing protein